MKINLFFSLLLLGAFTAAAPADWKRQDSPGLDGTPTPGSTVDRDWGPGNPPDVWKREADAAPKSGPTTKPDWEPSHPGHIWNREAAPKDEKPKPWPPFRGGRDIWKRAPISHVQHDNFDAVGNLKRASARGSSLRDWVRQITNPKLCKFSKSACVERSIRYVKNPKYVE
ncbi:hypothetical protein TWF569_003503 [Orbilia oligospora]|uniref:Uncharacterized protein n=1 Tax=Orbilia oligospora TaxID=2813651 RepID=A0A7C8NSX3_ORBOL|nr:hypothetical protein TWF706_007862 [Orbilia oligospora]KAF3105901.1 hypothetical protein TWF102_001805 [Orbilia oligospora]KAF3112563.1 hypothetical protein TWF103_002811 [Orbilia oligospora]KAF3136888.1 hypothetical protein TWF594_007775 [Orbilia oligospora]KAF3151787.1 hypothetical protein TWF569_003503 [Orbilia oligospora]